MYYDCVVCPICCRLIGSDFATAAVLISFGAVLGRASPVQLILMAVIEIVVFQFNELIVFYVLKVYAQYLIFNWSRNWPKEAN